MSHPASQFQIRSKDCFTIFYGERGQERHGNYINSFSERNLIQSNLVISEQKQYDVPPLTLNLLSGILLILHNKRDQELHKNFISCFLRKNPIWSNLIFLVHFLMFDCMCSKLSQTTVTTGSLKSQDMIKILKQSEHDLSGKRLCGGSCTQILWDVYVWGSQSQMVL